MPDEQNWIILGDFNVIRRLENRNKPGGDPHLMLAFNEAISNLGILKLPLKGQTFTWSNKQQNPLLQRLHWFFISNAWSLEFLGTIAKTLVRDTSDHVPCVIKVKTDIPRANIFRFENYWLAHDEFESIFQEAWNRESYQTDPAKKLMAKLKVTRKCLKDWQRSLPKLAKTIANTQMIIQLFDLMEE
jgi:hypothetical protein